MTNVYNQCKWTNVYDQCKWTNQLTSIMFSFTLLLQDHANSYRHHDRSVYPLAMHACESVQVQGTWGVRYASYVIIKMNQSLVWTAIGSKHAVRSAASSHTLTPWPVWANASPPKNKLTIGLMGTLLSRWESGNDQTVTSNIVYILWKSPSFCKWPHWVLCKLYISLFIAEFLGKG